MAKSRSPSLARKVFAYPFNTIGLVIAGNVHGGLYSEIHDVTESNKLALHAPEEIYDMLVVLGAPGRYCVLAAAGLWQPVHVTSSLSHMRQDRPIEHRKSGLPQSPAYHLCPALP
ncbi:MAG: fructose 1,6-bisphosphatase [Dehalococcoidia bacterium]|nr:fructose 1,6-bisphosphatase [Dehalococcoidia bacterium]